MDNINSGRGGVRGVPLVESWGCLKAMVASWTAARCGVRLGDYGMRHTRLLANLCNAGVDPAAVGSALRDAGGGSGGEEGGCDDVGRVGGFGGDPAVRAGRAARARPRMEARLSTEAS